MKTKGYSSFLGILSWFIVGLRAVVFTIPHPTFADDEKKI